MTASTASRASMREISTRIIPFVAFTLACYLAIGVQLAILPSFVHLNLGYGTVLAGLIISIEYVATMITRPQAGRMADHVGAKQAVLYGLATCGTSGILTLLAAFSVRTPWLALTLLVAARLMLGASESLCSTGATLWGILSLGAENTAVVISWNGICTFGGMAAGAPVGVYLEKYLGFSSVGVAVILLGFVPLPFAWRMLAVPASAGEKQPFHHVFRRILPHGMGLALGTAGFGVIATFITLDFASRNWPNAAFALTLFGALFVGTRLVFSNAINRVGGFPVTIACFAVEGMGQGLLWLSSTEWVAFLGAALTGAGFALVFPALGTEAVRHIPAQDRGTALGAYTAFMDFSMMIIGPGAGAIISGFGYPAIYLSAGLAALAGIGLTRWLEARERKALIA